ncbi:MAG TPA: VTT domain-containing protein [Deltaproteobacteria bacterium]|nr:VTT domain-containing protein [Deltaproteobacteria bacterium]
MRIHEGSKTLKRTGIYLGGLILILMGFLVHQADFSLGGIIHMVGDLSWMGVILYMACFTVGIAFFVPATPLAMAGGIVFGPWLGFLAVQTSSLVAACAIFIAVRTVKPLVGAEGLKALLPDWIAAKIRENAMLFMVYARTLLVPDPAVNYGASALSISFREYFWGTLLGSLPHNLAIIFLCTVARDALLGQDLHAVLTWEVLPAIPIALSGLYLVHVLRRQIAR